MRRRLLVSVAVLGALVLVLAGLGYFKVRQIGAAIEAGKGFAPPPAAITTVVAEEEEIEPVLRSVGSVAAVNGVVVSTDLPGLVERIAFDSGLPVKAGDLLVQLDARQEVAQLRAAEAKRELARANLERIKELWAKRVSAKSEYDQMAAEFQQADASVEEMRALIERKTVRAPFDGILGIREVNKGQYVKSGDAIVPLQSLDPIYVNFALPQQHLHKLESGATVKVTAEGLPGEEFRGEISAVNSTVDEATRNIQVQATLRNPALRLRPGMFVDVRVQLPAAGKSVVLPASAVNYAPYFDSVFIVEEKPAPGGKGTMKVARQQAVKLGAAIGDRVVVLSGVKPGEEVVSSGVFKLRDGAPVFVNNAIQPSNEANPQPAES